MNRMVISVEKLGKYLVPFVFVIYLVTGLFIYDDYGVSTDESTHRKISSVYLLSSIEQIGDIIGAEKIVTKIRKEKEKEPEYFKKYSDTVCGEAFGVPLLMLEVASCGIKNNPTKEIYEIRHLFTFLFNFIGIIFLYFIIRQISGKRSVAILITIAYMVSPRFFAESFYNPQDTIFLTACIITMFFYLRFLKEKTIKNAILLGFFAAFATDIRFLGIQFILLALFFVFLSSVKSRKILKSEVISSFIMLPVYIFFVFLMYPQSWPSPVDFFGKWIGLISDFPRDTLQLFMGNWVESTNLPWYYIPAWMLVTIPVVYILFFFHGLYISARQLVSKEQIREFSYDYQVMLTAVMMFFVPLAGVILNGSVFYSGWRHMFFLYLSFLVIASYSIRLILLKLEERGKAFILYSGLGVYFISLVVWMVINHPYQYVFFNALPHSIESRYEKDYWSVSMRDGMEYLLKSDHSEVITIKRSKGSATQARNMLPKDMKKRIEIMDDDSGQPDNYDYFIYVGDGYGKKNTFNTKRDYSDDEKLAEVYSIKAYNSIYTQRFKILSIFRKKE